MALDWGTVPAWAAVGVAVVGGAIAFVSVQTQRDIAKRRASLDLLMKTVTDPAFNKVTDAYLTTVGEAARSGMPVRELLRDPGKSRIVAQYLNAMDLIAVGVHTGVLNEDVCFDFWRDEVIRAYEETKDLIDALRVGDRNPFAFIDLEKLATSWAARRNAMAEKHRTIRASKP
jgi:Domain of unknown function (DUF4760)